MTAEQRDAVFADLRPELGILDALTLAVLEAEPQTDALELRHTGMAVIDDIGEPTNIHPKDKQDVGKRLALAAQAIAYGEKLSVPVLRRHPQFHLNMRITGGRQNRGDTAMCGQWCSASSATP